MPQYAGLGHSDSAGLGEADRTLTASIMGVLTAPLHYCHLLGQDQSELQRGVGNGQPVSRGTDMVDSKSALVQRQVDHCTHPGHDNNERFVEGRLGGQMSKQVA